FDPVTPQGGPGDPFDPGPDCGIGIEWRSVSERLVTAYQEVVTLPQLRQRMPALQKQAQAVGSELQSLEMAALDEAKYLQLAESLGGFEPNCEYALTRWM